MSKYVVFVLVGVGGWGGGGLFSIPLVFALFWGVQTVVWLPLLGIFNMHIYVNACNSTRSWRLYEHIRDQQ